MNKWLVMSLICFVVGSVVLLFHEQILKFQGESKKEDYPIETRRRTLILGGVGCILFGIISLLNWLK